MRGHFVVDKPGRTENQATRADRRCLSRRSIQLGTQANVSALVYGDLESRRFTAVTFEPPYREAH
jgi:hypothetical protein